MLPRAFLLFSLMTALLLSLASGVSAATPADHLTADRAFTVTVQDHDGSIKPGATVTIRDGETYALTYQVITNPWGQATVTLRDTHWYVVTVTAPDHGAQEFWYYNYILPNDWNDGPSKVLRRKDPWIDTVDLPAVPVPVGQPLAPALTIDHDHDATNYDLKIRVSMWVDDDGQEPYLYEQTADIQNFFTGIEPFVFSYTPPAPGTYKVRFLIERQFEQNPWYIADEGGWEWTLRAGEPEPTPTPVPCQFEGRVFYDGDRDGELSAGDAGLAQAEVHLCSSAGAVLRTESTDPDGVYRFASVTPGDYVIGLGRLPREYVRDHSVIPVVGTPGDALTGIDFAVWDWRAHLPCIIK